MRTPTAQIIVRPLAGVHLAQRAILVPFPQRAHTVTLSSLPLANVPCAIRLLQCSLPVPQVVLPFAKILLRASILLIAALALRRELLCEVHGPPRSLLARELV